MYGGINAPNPTIYTALYKYNHLQSSKCWKLNNKGAKRFGYSLCESPLRIRVSCSFVPFVGGNNYGSKAWKTWSNNNGDRCPMSSELWPFEGIRCNCGSEEDKRRYDVLLVIIRGMIVCR